MADRLSHCAELERRIRELAGGECSREQTRSSRSQGGAAGGWRQAVLGVLRPRPAAAVLGVFRCSRPAAVLGGAFAQGYTRSAKKLEDRQLDARLADWLAE